MKVKSAHSIAPEQLDKRIPIGFYTDAWSLGVIAY